MLYAVEKPSLEVLTHGYSPFHEVNGFRQVGDRKPPQAPTAVGLSATETVEFTSPSNTAKEGQRGITLITPVLVSKPDGGGPVTRTPLVQDPAGTIVAGGVTYSPRVSPLISNGTNIQPSITGGTKNVGFSRDSFGAEDLFRGQMKGQSGGSLMYSKGRSDDDPYYGDPGLSGWLSKTTKKLKKSVKKAVGNKVYKVAHRVVAVNVGGAVGAATGFVTGGGPQGAIAGAIAGGTKALHDTTRTGKPSITTKSVYQSAAYGAGAGAVTRAVSTGYDYYASNLSPQARSAAMAKKVGFGAARDTAMAAGTYTPPVVAPVSLTSKIIGGTLKNPIVQGVATNAILQGRGSSGAGDPVAADGGQAPIIINPGTPGITYQPGYGPISGGGYSEGGYSDSFGGGSGGSSAPGSGEPEAEPGFLQKNAPLLAAGSILAFFMLRKVKVG